MVVLMPPVEVASVDVSIVVSAGVTVIEDEESAGSVRLK